MHSVKLVNAAQQVYSTLCPMVLSPGGPDYGPAPFQPKHCFFFLWKPELSERIREMVHREGRFSPAADLGVSFTTVKAVWQALGQLVLLLFTQMSLSYLCSPSPCKTKSTYTGADTAECLQASDLIWLGMEKDRENRTRTHSLAVISLFSGQGSHFVE